MGCTEKNPLKREGTSIITRMLAALATSYAKPDERQAADLLLFLRRYASYLNYHDSSTGKKNGDWELLMKMDISVTLAVLMKLDARKALDYKKLLYKRIKNASNDTNARREFKYVFDLVFSCIKIIAEQYHQLPGSFEYKLVIKNIIETKILAHLVNLDDLFGLVIADNLVANIAGIDSSAPIATSSCFDFEFPGDIGEEWVLPQPDQGLTIPPLAGAKDRIVFIINHNFFNAQVESLLKAVSVIAEKAAALFTTTLTNYPSHTPHYALIIAFVKLFSIAQDDLNRYTQRHLDFYYKEALQLTNKKAEADLVHLLFELQKPVPKHLLNKGTLFKGGKNSITGKELTYSLTEDIVFNKATVEKIQSLQVLDRAKRIVAASPVAASTDGQGAKLSSPDKSWFTFGDPTTIKEANLGFAIASNILFLNEGTRTISITAKFENGTTSFADPSLVSHSGYFTGKLTGNKGWHDVEMTVSANAAGDQLIFSCTLGPTDPPIIPYTESIHKENIETDLPVLKIYLNQSLSFSYPYHLLSIDRLRSITADAEVSGVKDLVLSNNTGSIDASKPFKPFGEFPTTDASFYIGSKEIFQKNLTELSFVFGNVIEHKRDVEYLYNGTWDISHKLTNNTDTLALSGNVFPPAAKDFSKNAPLSATTNEGFIRLLLSSSRFSMDEYLDNVKEQINNTKVKRTTDTQVTYQIETPAIATPEQLVLSSFSVNYKASAVIHLNNTSTIVNNRFLHLTPFGYSEVAFDAGQPSKKITLVPEIVNDGELFVGLKNTEPEEVINILFQVAEGSSNPLRDVAQVKWYYLATGNNWREFKTQDIIDRTNDFSQSGIVTITLPPDICDQCTALQKGLYWIKAAVQQFPDAVCKMILVQAQAAQVMLVQDEEKQLEFSHTLPANTISKLITGDSAVKSITQPFDSFGGRPKETDEHFYLRVSERLRHKQRAITIWDYEHIILEKFPQISKVRCINHAGFYKDINNTDIFCENYPGHVTIITIPDFRNKTGINPLKPYTPVGLINNIDIYLNKIISPFVKLHLKNPQFEEIQLEFNVTFHENLDDAFYRQLLGKEIEKFLTPWAYDGASDISFGGKIIKSEALNFVEERPYVDFVTDFKMHHIIKRAGNIHELEQRDIEEAIPSTARSLLVSYSNELTKMTHIINSPAVCEC